MTDRRPFRRRVVSLRCAAPLLLSGAISLAYADGSLPLPLSGAAYAVAQAAQRDYNARRYDDSATQAREAIRQRPDVVDLRLLLANALAAGGHQRDAIKVIDDARKDFGDQRVLISRRQQILVAGRPYTPTPAFLAAQEAYRAYARQDYPAAQEAARHSLDLDPNSMMVRLLMVDTLAAQHKDAEAYAAIQRALAMDTAAPQQGSSTGTGTGTGGGGRASNDAALSQADAARDLADRRAVVGARLAIPDATAAALALKNGDTVQAVKEAKTAVMFAPNDPTYRELLVAALLADGQAPAADSAATEALSEAFSSRSADGASDSDPGGAMFWVWRAFARAQQNLKPAAIADATTALGKLPSLDTLPLPATQARAAPATRGDASAQAPAATPAAFVPQRAPATQLGRDLQSNVGPIGAPPGSTVAPTPGTAAASVGGSTPVDDDTNLRLARRTRVINARLSLADLALYLGDATLAMAALQPLHDALARTGGTVGGARTTPADINTVAVTQRWQEAQALARGTPPTLARLYPPPSPRPPDTDADVSQTLVATASSQRAIAVPTPAAASAQRATSRGPAAPPILECTLSTFGPACMTYPYDPAYAAYQAGARAFDRRDYAAAVQGASDAVRIAPDDATHQLLLIDALNADGRQAAARRVANRAVDHGVLDAVPDLQAGYLAAAADRPQLAAARFRRADADGDLPPSGYLDAGYAMLQTGNAPVASTYFKRAIDANHAGTIAIPAPVLLDTRRTESEIDRRGGITVSTSYRPGVASGLQNNPSTSTANKSLQTSVEGYWRPWGYMGGHMVEVYARVSGTLWDDRSGFASTSNSGARDGGVASLSGAVGVRGRPFASQNLVLALEREIPIGRNATSDWLARAAYSNGFGTMIRYDVPSWWTGTVYGEVGRYLLAGKNYWTTEADLGRTYRIDAIKPEATIFPYAVIGGDYNQLTNNGYGVGLGVGVTMRWQFRENLYHAPQSYLQGSVQYRFKIAGDDRAKGVFINLTYGY